MEKSFKNINDTTQELVITLSRNEVEPAVSEAYKELSSKIQLDGFRKGKVPLHLIKSMYGNQIEEEEHHKLVDKYFKEFIDETPLSIVSQPMLVSLEKKDGGIEFKLVYDYIPEFQLSDYKNIIADEPVHRVTEDEVAKNIEMIAYNRGTLEEVELAENKDYIVSIVPKSTYDAHFEKEDAKIEDLKVDRIYLRNGNILPEFTDVIIGKKKGETFEWSNPTSKHDHDHDHDHNHDHDHDHDHNHDHDHDHDHNQTITFVITKVEKITPIEFTEENILKISNNKFNNFEDYKLALELEIQNDWDSRSNDILVENIIDYLIAQHDIKLPQSYILERAEEFVKERAKQTKNENLKFENLSDTDKEHYTKLAEKVIKFSLIREAIIKAEGIEVEEHDIDNHVNKLVGSLGGDEAQYFEQFKEIIKKDKNIINQILGEKVMDLLKDFTTTNEVAFPVNDIGFEDDFYEEEEDENEEYDIFEGDEEIFDEEFEEDEEWDEDEDDWNEEDDEEWDDDEEDDDEDEEDEWDDDEEEASKNK